LIHAPDGAFATTEDAVGRWIEEQCEEVPRFSATAILFANWKVWAERNNEYTGSVRSFSQNLADRQGLKRDKVNGIAGVYRDLVKRGAVKGDPG